MATQASQPQVAPVPIQEFKYFQRLPPEIRNEIYKLLLDNNYSINITSPRNRRKKTPPKSSLAPLLSVSKQISAEAKTVFYSLNTFVISNQDWGSRTLPNLHGLKAFTSRVTTECIAKIQSIRLGITVAYQHNFGLSLPPAECYIKKCEAQELQATCRSIVKHFVGIKAICVYAACPGRYLSVFRTLDIPLTGHVDDTVKAMAILMGHPRLEELSFDSSELVVDWKELFQRLVDGRPNWKEKITLP